MGEVVANFSIGDTATMLTAGAISFPIGYAIGRPLRKETMWVAGFLGSVAGFMLAYQNASARMAGSTQLQGAYGKK